MVLKDSRKALATALRSVSPPDKKSLKSMTSMFFVVAAAIMVVGDRLRVKMGKMDREEGIVEADGKAVAYMYTIGQWPRSATDFVLERKPCVKMEFGLPRNTNYCVLATCFTNARVVRWSTCHCG